MTDVPALLVAALLPLHATAPSTFTINGFQSLAACEYARAEVTKQHHPFGKDIKLWMACIPSSPPHKD